MTSQRPYRPSGRLAALAADLAAAIAAGPGGPAHDSRIDLLRRLRDDRETIGELANAVNRLDHRVAELEAAIGTTDREASHA